MSRRHGIRTARNVVLVLVLALVCLVSAAQASASESQQRHPPKPHHLGTHQKAKSTAHPKAAPTKATKATPASTEVKGTEDNVSVGEGAKAQSANIATTEEPSTQDRPTPKRNMTKTSQGSPPPTKPRSSHHAEGQGAGSPTVNPPSMRGSKPRSPAATSTAAPAPSPTRSPTPAPAGTTPGSGTVGGASLRGTTSTPGPSLGIAPTDGGVLLPGAGGGTPRSPGSHPDSTPPLGAEFVNGAGGMTNLNVAAVMGLLLGTFVIALAAIVIVAGHRGGRPSAHHLAEHRNH
jgi:hypothetical protein